MNLSDYLQSEIEIKFNWNNQIGKVDLSDISLIKSTKIKDIVNDVVDTFTLYDNIKLKDKSFTDEDFLNANITKSKIVFKDQQLQKLNDVINSQYEEYYDSISGYNGVVLCDMENQTLQQIIFIQYLLKGMNLITSDNSNKVSIKSNFDITKFSMLSTKEIVGNFDLEYLVWRILFKQLTSFIFKGQNNVIFDKVYDKSKYNYSYKDDFLAQFYIDSIQGKDSDYFYNLFNKTILIGLQKYVNFDNPKEDIEMDKLRQDTIIKKMFSLDLDEMSDEELLEDIINNWKRLIKKDFHIEQYLKIDFFTYLLKTTYSMQVIENNNTILIVQIL